MDRIRVNKVKTRSVCNGCVTVGSYNINMRHVNRHKEKKENCELCRFYAQQQRHIDVLGYTDRIFFLQKKCNELMKKNAQLLEECKRLNEEKERYYSEIE